MTPLPKITPELEKYQRVLTKKYPKPLIKNPKIKKLRITTKPSFGHGNYNNIDIYPEYQYRNKWYVFRTDKDYIIFTILRQTINGISISDTKTNKIKKEIKKWLKTWMKENNIHWDKPGDQNKKVEEQSWKTLVPSVKEVMTNTLISEVKLRMAKVNVALIKSLQ